MRPSFEEEKPEETEDDELEEDDGWRVARYRSVGILLIASALSPLIFTSYGAFRLSVFS